MGRFLQAFQTLIWAAAIIVGLAACSQEQAAYDVHNVPLPVISADLAAGRVTSTEVTKAYLKRIEARNSTLHAVIAIAPDAERQAAASDRRRHDGHALGPLDGVPILFKDNIDVVGLPTTAGSFALAKNNPAEDATIARKLKEAGAIIVGKTNLSEWANIRASKSVSGWSAIGGVTRNPYDLSRSACGSSSGSAVAVSSSLIAAAVGTETNGSIVCPSSLTGTVGLKPTVGLVSRTGIIPITNSIDTAGPIASSVKGAAMLLTVMAGSDPKDAKTQKGNGRRVNYAEHLDANALYGVRIGILKSIPRHEAPTQALFDQALDLLRSKGAILVDIEYSMPNEVGGYVPLVLLTEFKVGLNLYLENAPSNVTIRNLADLISFNSSNPQELQYFDQDLLEAANKTTGIENQHYIDARQNLLQITGPNGIDRLLAENKVVALIAPTTGPAWPIDFEKGDAYTPSISGLPALAGYPHLTEPMGLVDGLPVGISFIGPAWSEQLLLSLGYAYEQAANARIPPQD